MECFPRLVGLQISWFLLRLHLLQSVQPPRSDVSQTRALGDDRRSLLTPEKALQSLPGPMHTGIHPVKR